tara:strand:+ start:143 stop:472 length:330 start_codon:yes stop_codon:yes gene_type:complete
MEKIMTLKNKDFSENYYSDPKVTHPEIKIDVSIPHEWDTCSYTHDVCPSFASPNGLQIFVMDEETKKLEGFENKYSIIIAEEYGEGNDLFNSNDWNEILNFVKNYGGKK